ARALPVIFSLSTLILGCVALGRFDPSFTGMQFNENHPWITALNVRYHLGLDGLSLVLVLLTGIVSPLALFGTTRSVRDPAHSGALAAKLGGGFWPQAIFLGVLLGLAVKVPLFPFHAWLPPAYAEAPTGTSMFLTGVMSKMGAYGFLRILWPIFTAPLHAAT